MAHHIGNTGSFINWNEVIDICKKQFDRADKNTVTSVVDRSEAEAIGDNNLLSQYRKVIGTWKDAGYKLEDIVWYDYYPGVHFPIEVQDTFSKIIGAQPLRVFVSEVFPGQIVPYHWDVEDKEEQWLKDYGNLYRYVCCIDKPRFGSVLVFNDNALYYNKQGDIFQWTNYKDYHSAANAGNYPQYYFHFLGHK